MAAKHQQFVSEELWHAAQQAREANTKSGRLAIRRDTRVYSLSGLATCSYCGGKMHIRPTNRGITYRYCYRRGQAVSKDCQQKATDLSDFETQMEQYLSQIKLPPVR